MAIYSKLRLKYIRQCLRAFIFAENGVGSQAKKSPFRAAAQPSPPKPTATVTRSAASERPVSIPLKSTSHKAKASIPPPPIAVLFFLMGADFWLLLYKVCFGS